MRLTLRVAAAGAVALPLIAQAAPGDVSVDRGKLVSIIGGCNDCHTSGYNELQGQIDPAKALAGTAIGWQGPWGTTYPANIRLKVKDMTEDQFVAVRQDVQGAPAHALLQRQCHGRERSALALSLHQVARRSW